MNFSNRSFAILSATATGAVATIVSGVMDIRKQKKAAAEAANNTKTGDNTVDQPAADATGITTAG